MSNKNKPIKIAKNFTMPKAKRGEIVLELREKGRQESQVGDQEKEAPSVVVVLRPRAKSRVQGRESERRMKGVPQRKLSRRQI